MHRDFLCKKEQYLVLESSNPISVIGYLFLVTILEKGRKTKKLEKSRLFVAIKKIFSGEGLRDLNLTD